MKPMRKMKIWSFGKEFFGAPMPSCRQVAEWMDDFTDEEIPLGRKIMLKVHLMLCPDCRRYLATYRQTRQMLGQVSPLTMPEKSARHMEALLTDRFLR